MDNQNREMCQVAWSPSLLFFLYSPSSHLFSHALPPQTSLHLLRDITLRSIKYGADPNSQGSSYTLQRHCASHLYLTRIPLTEIGPGGIKKNKCNKFEKELEHIPNMKSLDDNKTFSWAKRRLVGLSNIDKDDSAWKADYMMYMCLNKRSGPPQNMFLTRFVEIDKNPIKVYGDAFVFAMECQPKGSEHERAKYVDMDKEFVQSVGRGHGAWTTLRKLLVRPAREG